MSQWLKIKIYYIKMIVSVLETELLSLILYGYSKNIPIIEAAVEKEDILRVIMELYKYPVSKLSTSNIRYVDFLFKRRILRVSENEYTLSEIGNDIARKLEKEIDIYRKYYYDYYIDHENLNLDRILKKLCNELISNYNPIRYCFHPIFQVIYVNRDKPALTPTLIGRYGFFLLVLYNEENKCDECVNWGLLLRDIRHYLYNYISDNCHNKFKLGIVAKYLSIYGLITQRGSRRGKHRYNLTKYGYDLSEYLIKNLAIAYRHLEERTGSQ